MIHSLQLKRELETVCAQLLPLVVSMSATRPCPPHLLTHLTSDLREMEDKARSKVNGYILCYLLNGCNDPLLKSDYLLCAKSSSDV